MSPHLTTASTTGNAADSMSLSRQRRAIRRAAGCRLPNNSYVVQSVTGDKDHPDPAAGLTSYTLITPSRCRSCCHTGFQSVVSDRSEGRDGFRSSAVVESGR